MIQVIQGASTRCVFTLHPRNVSRILVRKVSAPLPLEAKKILKI